MARHRPIRYWMPACGRPLCRKALTRAECRGGVVNGLRCGRHDNLLSRPSRDMGERGRGTYAEIRRSILNLFCPSDA
jgi:hypothetical protein